MGFPSSTRVCLYSWSFYLIRASSLSTSIFFTSASPLILSRSCLRFASFSWRYLFLASADVLTRAYMACNLRADSLRDRIFICMFCRR